MQAIAPNTEPEERPCFFKYRGPKLPPPVPTSRSTKTSTKSSRKELLITQIDQSRGSIKPAPSTSGLVTTVNLSAESLEPQWKAAVAKPLMPKSLLYKVHSQRVGKLASTAANTVASLGESKPHSSANTSASTLFEVKGAGLEPNYTYGKFLIRKPSNMAKVHKHKRL